MAPKKSQSRLDREVDEILAKKAREPIPISRYQQVHKQNQSNERVTIMQGIHATWEMLLVFPLLLAFVLVIAAKFLHGFSPLLALLLVTGAVWAIWWPGLRRLGQAKSSQEPTVHYWRGRPYRTNIQDAASRHPIDQIKRYFDQRR